MAAENTPQVKRRVSWAAFLPTAATFASGKQCDVDPAHPHFVRPSASHGWLNGSSKFNIHTLKRPSSSGGRLSNHQHQHSWFGAAPSISGLHFTPFLKRPSSSGGLKEFPILSPPIEEKETPICDSPTTTTASPPSPMDPPSVPSAPAPSTSTPAPVLPADAAPSAPAPPLARARVRRTRPATSDGTPPFSFSAPRRWASSLLLTPSKRQASDGHSPPLPEHALERTHSEQISTHSAKGDKNGSSFGKSLSSMMGGLSSLTLSRTSTRTSVDEDKDRGRSMLKLKRFKSASQAPPDHDREASLSRARSQSPFSFRRWRSRESSPTPQPVRLGQSDGYISDTSILPRNSAYSDDDSGDETMGTDAETDDADSINGDIFDPITERNTEQNAMIAPVTDPAQPADIEDPDPVGEGPNVVIAPEPYFPSTLNTPASATRGKRNPRRRKSVKAHEPLPFNTTRPVFQRDRATITITQGDPVGKLGDRRKRRYVVASDLSEESRYAVEWGIGTVLRDGDEMVIVTVVENESKTDPVIPNTGDRTVKLRAQQERQGLAYILVRQATSLLQRTRLNVTIACQAWHAKNSRHMLLDIVDHIEPTMLIVGSRGLGRLNDILLGSTSHYLIQKCSVPVMVARRRLKRPAKKSAHLSPRRRHVSLAEAGIDRVAGKVDQDVKVMRDEMQKDEKSRDGGPGSRDERFAPVPEAELAEVEDEGDDEDEPAGIKVAG